MSKNKDESHLGAIFCGMRNNKASIHVIPTGTVNTRRTRRGSCLISKVKRICTFFCLQFKKIQQIKLTGYVCTYKIKKEILNKINKAAFWPVMTGGWFNISIYPSIPCCPLRRWALGAHGPGEKEQLVLVYSLAIFCLPAPPYSRAGASFGQRLIVNWEEEWRNCISMPGQRERLEKSN